MRTVIHYIRNSSAFSVLIALITLWQISAAQTVSNELNTGVPENAVLHGSDLDNVSVNNGNLHISIPIWSAKGRGLDTGFNIVYDNKGWTFTRRCTTMGGCTDTVAEEAGHNMILTLRGPFDYALANKSAAVCGNPPPTSVTKRINYTMREPDGTKHHFSP